MSNSTASGDEYILFKNEFRSEPVLLKLVPGTGQYQHIVEGRVKCTHYWNHARAMVLQDAADILRCRETITNAEYFRVSRAIEEAMSLTGMN